MKTRKKKPRKRQGFYDRFGMILNASLSSSICDHSCKTTAACGQIMF
jgi:hypothetical protein